MGNGEPDLDVEDDLVSFKVDDDKEFPSWVTETLRLGDWTPMTRSDVGHTSLNVHKGCNCRATH